MKSLQRYLDNAKLKHGLTKNDQLSKKLGIPPNHVSQWYHGVSHPGDEGMVKLAQLLKINPLEIIASVNYQKAATSIKREYNPKRNAAQRKFWWQVYEQTVRKR